MHTHYLPFDVNLQFVQNLECVLRDIVTENADLLSKILIKERLIANCRQLLKMKVRTDSLEQLEVYQLNYTCSGIERHHFYINSSTRLRVHECVTRCK